MTTETKSGVKFPLGRVVMTCGVAAAIENGEIEAEAVRRAIERHESGDWGIMPDEDKAANEDALKYGERLMSAYEIAKCIPGAGAPEWVKVWVITESDRSATTVLYPDEY